MADEKRGLPRPKAPVDLFTLQPEPELVAEIDQAEATAPPKPARAPAVRSGSRGQQSRTRDKARQQAAVPRAERIKTSVELLPETLERIDQLKAQYRREHRRHLPVWKLMDEAIRELAARRLK